MKIRSIYLLLVLLLLLVPYSICTDSSSKIIHYNSEYNLPPPLKMNASIEYLLHRRTCIRSFSSDPVTDEQLSTILWAAYGLRECGKQTISPINGSLAVKIYVMKEEAAYWYNPINHSLIHHIDGDYRGMAQRWAPVVLGLVWDRSLNKKEDIVSAQIGQVGQNLFLSSSSLGLGLVPTSDYISPLLNIDLPTNEVGKLVIPLGHPTNQTIWKYRPWYFSGLPRIKDSSSCLTNLLKNKTSTESFEQEKLSKSNISQLLWACYGYSYYIDVQSSSSIKGQRHRTVPSGHGYYPLEIYAVTPQGIYHYIHGLTHMDFYGLPILSFLLRIRKGDYIEKIAECSQSFVKDSQFLIISVLNIKHTQGRGLRGDDFSAPEYRFNWFYEAGSCAQNVLLEATAWGLSGNIVEISNQEDICRILKLNQDYIPQFVIPIGRAST